MPNTNEQDRQEQRSRLAQLNALKRRVHEDKRRLLLVAAESGTIPSTRDLERIADLEMTGHAVDATIEEGGF